MEARDDQVAFMLLSGEVKDKLTEDDKNLVESDGAILESGTFGYLGNVETGAAGGLAAAAVAAAATIASVKLYKRFLSKAAKACSGKSGLEKTSCMTKFKKQAQAAKVQALQSGIAKCSKSKDPTSCKAKLQGKINKEKAKMGAL